VAVWQGRGAKTRLSGLTICATYTTTVDPQAQLDPCDENVQVRKSMRTRLPLRPRLPSGRRGRGFKSRHPDKKSQVRGLIIDKMIRPLIV
jgi:hypothetical protein